MRISGTRKEVLDQLAAELKERVHVLPCDLSDKDQVEALVPQAEEAMGKLDILVANAGITRTICSCNCATRTGTPSSTSI